MVYPQYRKDLMFQLITQIISLKIISIYDFLLTSDDRHVLTLTLKQLSKEIKNDCF